jgi:hypothetical protein
MPTFGWPSSRASRLSLSVTDVIYGIFSEEEVKNRITGLNNLPQGEKYSDEELRKLAEMIADKLGKINKKA